MPPIRSLPISSDVLKQSGFLSLQERMSKDLFAFDAEQRKNDDALALENIGNLHLPEDGGVTGTTGYEGMLGDAEAPDAGGAAPEAPTDYGAATEAPRRTTGLMSPTLDMPAMAQPRRQPVYDPTQTIDIQGEPDYDPSADMGTVASEPTGVTGLSAPNPGASSAPADPSSWEGKAYAAAVKAGHPNPTQFAEQMRWESGNFDPDVIAGKRNSSAGAQGIAQIVPRYHPDVDPLNPDAALDYAARLMKSHYDQYGDSDTALAAYNGGAGAVAAMRAGHPYGETQQYLSEINHRVTGRAQITNPAIAPTQRAAEDRVYSGEMRTDDVAQSALRSPTKWSECGPVAAVIAANRRGKDWTPEQAKQIAQSNSLWDAGTGMYGLQAEVKLLNQMGLGARTGPADQNALAADAQAGNTPIISTNTHYFILTDYNPQTGQFDTSTSGTALKGGSRWLTLQQINDLGGGIQGAAYMDNPSSPAPSAVAPPSTPNDPTARRERDALALTAGAPPAEPPFSAPAGASTPVGASDLAMKVVENPSGIAAPGVGELPPPVPDLFGSSDLDQSRMQSWSGQYPQVRNQAVPGQQRDELEEERPPWQASGGGMMQRQPLSQQPELPPDLPLDPDQGPHELIPPGAVSAPPIISPLAPNENPGVSTTAALPAPPQIEITQGGPPTPSAQWTPVETRPLPVVPPATQVVEQSSPWPQIPGLQPVLDAAGNVVAWVQGQAQAAGQQISENMAGNRQAVEDANAGREGGVDFGTGAQNAGESIGNTVGTEGIATPISHAISDPINAALGQPPAPRTGGPETRVDRAIVETGRSLGSNAEAVRSGISEGNYWGAALGALGVLGDLAPSTTLARQLNEMAPKGNFPVVGEVGLGDAIMTAALARDAVRLGYGAIKVGGRTAGKIAQAIREGVPAERFSQWVQGNAERVAAADARAAERGSVQAPGVFGVSGIEPNRPEVQGMRPRVIPPHVVDDLDIPVRNPTDPNVIRAIEAAGGTVDERGVTLNVIRNQGPEAHGNTATRGMTFYIAGPPGTHNPYATAAGSQTGGPVRIEAPTRFRSPLILSDAPGDEAGFARAMEQLGVTDGTGHPLTPQTVNQRLRLARAAGPEGSPARAQALKDLVARYGGEPELIDDLLAVRGADASESAWAIKENIVATNARKQGYDGVVTVQQKPQNFETQMALNEAVDAHPDVVAARQAYRDATDAYVTPGDREAAQRMRQAKSDLDAARARVTEELRPYHITELADTREARNPTPGESKPEHPEVIGARAREEQAREWIRDVKQQADEGLAEWQRQNPGADPMVFWNGLPGKAIERGIADVNARLATAKAALAEALRSYPNPPSTEPGYTLRSDIPRRGPVRESTIAENPRVAAVEREYQEALAEHGKFYEQYMREAPGETFIGWARQSGNKAALDADTRLTKATYAYDQLGMSNEGRYVTAQASAGALPSSVPTDRLGAVNRVLGQGVASAVSGGVGAQVNQEMNPDDPYAGVKGFAVGALAPPLIARGARRVARAAGRDADGLLATFGVAPGSPIDPARVAAAAAEGPTRGAQLNRRLDPSGASIPLRVRAANAWTDDQAILRWAEDLLTQESGRGKLPEDAPERASTLRRRNPDSYTDQRIRDELAPVVGRARKEGLLDELTQYLQDTHERDVLAEFYTRGHEGATAAGKSAADADAEGIARMRRRASANADLDWETVNARLEGQKQRLGDQFDTLDELAQGVWDHNRTTLDRMLESGRISKGQHAWLSETYPHYVPTVPISHLDPGGGKVAVGHGSGISAGRSGPGDIKAFEDVASGSDRLNPIIASRDATIARERVAQKNEAFQAFARMYDDAMQSGSATTQASQGARRQVFAGEVEVSGRVDGEPTTIRVPKPVAEAIDAMSEMGAGDRMPAIWRAAMSAVTTSITGRRAAFLPVNLARDFGDSLIRAGATYGPQAIPEFLARWFAQAGNAAADLAVGAARGRLEVTGDATTYLRRGGGMGRAEGGWQKGEQWYDDVQRTGGVVFTNPQAFGSVMRDLATFKPIMAANERTELISRTAMMQMAEKRGAGPTEAMIAGRNASVDFNRAGTLARMLNSGIPFFNATVQGGAQLVRTLRDHPKSAAATLATVVGLPVAAAEAYNRSDPQRAQAYDDVPQYLKDQGIVVMLPWAGSDNRGERPNYLWLPLGMGAPVAVAMREAMRDMPGLEPASGRSDLPSDASDWQGWASVAEQVFGMLSPIKGESAAGAASSLIPPGAKQLVELGTNNNLYTGGTIASDTADERASAFGQGVADVANTAGRAIGSDLLQEVRPSHVDYLTRQLPAYGDVVSGVSDMVAPSGYKQAEDRPVANAPVVGGPASRIIRDTGGADMERARNDMLSETVRDALADAGMRPSDIQAVPSYLSVEGQQIPLMRDEQTTYQERTNTYADREISTTIRSGEWRARGADREKLVKDAMARARDRAEQDVLRRIPSSEQRRRTREAEAMAAR